MAKFCCEQCAYYDYDEEYDEYYCSVNLDEDEMEKYMSGNTNSCHYFTLYDEYKVVRKQNCGVGLRRRKFSAGRPQVSIN